MEPFNMSDLASHDKLHLVCVCVCGSVSRGMPNVCSITMKISILSDWLCLCVSMCVRAFYDNSFVLAKFIYLICTLSRLLPHPPLHVCVCVCVRQIKIMLKHANMR